MSNVSATIRRRSGFALLAVGVLVLAALVLGLRSAAPSTATAQSTTPAYLNASLPVDQRVHDLLSRMTLAEKVGQMGQINVEVLQGSPDTPWDRGPLTPALMTNVLDTNRIGSILSGGGAWPPVGDYGKAWAD
jgi:beta-glucosidase